jgi:hypothetical protein
MSKISLTPNASGTGNFTIASPNSSTDRTLTLPDNTGTIITTASTFAGTGPAFSAYNTSAQSVTSSTLTKITLQTEVFDTNNNFASSTFTPTVAGYYQINGVLRSTGTSITASIIAIYKNGSNYSYNSVLDGISTTSAHLIASEVIYMNGTTDYVELYGFITATSPAFGYASNSINCRFSGAMVRSA